jgi:methionine synthase II (cobalamin-independent)
LNDLGLAYNKTIRHFYDLGCRYIQIDDCFWGNALALGESAKTPEDFAKIDAICGNSVTVINLALKFDAGCLCYCFLQGSSWRSFKGNAYLPW